MKKIFSLLLSLALGFSSCAKKETCTCKYNNTVTYTESSTDSQKIETDCENYARQANSSGATVITVCTVQ